MNLQSFKHPKQIIRRRTWGLSVGLLFCLLLVGLQAGKPSSQRRATADNQGFRLSTQLLQDAKNGNAETRITLSEHQLTLLFGDEVALSCPVAIGCERHPTPTGDFQIKIQPEPYKLPYFGSYRDADDHVLITDIDRRKDPMPSGTHFVTEPVKYCLELEESGILIHSGQGLPGASTQGNIILPEAAAAALFGTLEDGDTIAIVAE